MNGVRASRRYCTGGEGRGWGGEGGGGERYIIKVML